MAQVICEWSKIPEGGLGMTELGNTELYLVAEETTGPQKQAEFTGKIRVPDIN